MKLEGNFFRVCVIVAMPIAVSSSFGVIGICRRLRGGHE